MKRRHLHSAQPKRPADACWVHLGASIDTSTQNETFMADGDKLVAFLKRPESSSSVLLLLADFNRRFDPSVVNGAVHTENHKVDYHDNKARPLGKETMWSMKGRPAPPALAGVVWRWPPLPLVLGTGIKWHMNTIIGSNFPNIFNFHRTRKRVQERGSTNPDLMSTPDSKNVNDPDQKGASQATRCSCCFKRRL